MGAARSYTGKRASEQAGLIVCSCSRGMPAMPAAPVKTERIYKSQEAKCAITWTRIC